MCLPQGRWPTPAQARAPTPARAAAFAAEGDALLDALLGDRDGGEAVAADPACGPGQSAPPATAGPPAADDSRAGVPNSAHPASATNHAPLGAAKSGARLRGVTVMTPGEYFPRLWAHCAPVADLAESLATAAAAAAAEGARPGAAATYRAHLGEAALEQALAAGAVMLVRRPARFQQHVCSRSRRGLFARAERLTYLRSCHRV